MPKTSVAITPSTNPAIPPKPARRTVGGGQLRLFGITGGELSVGGLPLSRLAAQVGSTPFFASDRAGFVSGQKLDVDGGYSV